jgi:lysophospholipase L1-like esterase
MGETVTRTIQALRAGQSRHIVCYGCSLTAGGAWVGHLRERLEELFDDRATVTNSGKSTMCSRWGVENLYTKVIALEPDLVFVEFSMNDAFLDYGVTLDECRDNLENMAERIGRARPACEIVIMVMNPVRGKSAGFRPRLEEFNQVYRDVARDRGLFLIDHYPAWSRVLTEDAARWERYIPDGLHPSPAGCEKVTTPEILAFLGI